MQQFGAKKLRNLKKPPIVESVCEIRFAINENLPIDLLTGMMVSRLSANAPVETLPALQMPEQIRKLDVNLRFIPYYKFQLNDVIVQVGPRILIIGSPLPYIGWAKMQQNLKTLLLPIIEDQNIIKIERIGLHAINFFDFDVLTKTTLSFNGPTELPVDQYNYLVVYNREKNKIKLQIANQVNFETPQTKRSGSIIDIDAFYQDDIKKNIDEVLEKLIELHDQSKEIFVQTITEAYLDELGPTYE